MIPNELTQNALWCVWRRETREGKPTKVPYNAITGKRAETNNPSTFCSYEIADETFRIDPDYNGVGILVSNGFAGIDIDHCVTDGELSDQAKDICQEINSYTELSPSKTGLRIIIQGDNLAYDNGKYYLKNKYNGVELYVSGMTNRFMTITGNTLLDLPIRRMTLEELTVFLEKYMLRPKGKASEGNVCDHLTDEQVVAKASQNEKFRAL